MAWFKRKQPAEPAAQTATEKAAEDFVAFEALDEVPRNPRDWPKGKMSYLTYGNEGDEAYGAGATGKIGPAEVAHHADGSVTVGGKLVDDPSKYKGKPITGGIIDQLTQHKDRNKELREKELREKDERDAR
jgi:hypothetical protein